jgi:hypothetical protein
MEKTPLHKREIPGGFAALFIFFTLAVFFDAFTTSLFMIRHGSEFEIHTLIRWSSALCGPVYGPLLGALAKTAAAILLSFLHRRAVCYALLLVTVISLFAGLYNLFAWNLTLSGTLSYRPF